MDTDEERDDLTDDDEPELDEATYREKAAAKLDQIVQEAKEALAKHGIGLSLFFVVPNNGRSILMFGTPSDPSDDLWTEVSEIVSAIVRQSIDLERTQCRSLLCAMTTPNSSS